MFERFTDRARRVIVLAQEEARMLDHDYIGTEHILLGLVHEGDGVAARALEPFGISVEGVREKVAEVIGQGQKPPSGHIPFTKRAKKVLELSLREALDLNHSYIGTEHLLLALVREGEGVGAQILIAMGADFDRVRAEVHRLVSAGPSPEHAQWVGRAVGMPVPEWSAGRAPDPAKVPFCPGCRMSLVGSIGYRVLDATEHEGEGKRRTFILYCNTCGRALDSFLLPEGDS